MRLCTVKSADCVGVAVDEGLVLLCDINRVVGQRLGPTLLDVITQDQVSDIAAALRVPAVLATARPLGSVVLGPLYLNPPKLWGVGLNYRKHADDLEVAQPVGMPGSYLRPSSTIIGHGDDIVLPTQSNRVTAEAELGVVIGNPRSSRQQNDAADVVFGFTTILDMTAEDAIRVNPRYIPWSKAFDTFCSIGPWLVTADEIADLSAVRISTVVNGRVIASNHVSAMMRDPYWQVEYFSQGMTLEAGSIIATGTPGAGVIQGGDQVEAQVTGVGNLRNGVRSAVPVA